MPMGILENNFLKTTIGFVLENTLHITIIAPTVLCK